MLLFILQSYAAAVAAPATLLSQEALHAHACGLSTVVLLVVLCDAATAKLLRASIAA